jgi:hypothetical protein
VFFRPRKELRRSSLQRGSRFGHCDFIQKAQHRRCTSKLDMRVCTWSTSLWRGRFRMQAWPFLVGGVICLVNSDNERDSILLNSRSFILTAELLRRTGDYNPTRLSNNRSVMPLDVQGCTRATLKSSTCEPNSEEVGKPSETTSC